MLHRLLYNIIIKMINHGVDMTTKTINVNELQSQVSSILKEVQSDTVFEVMRYSEPVAVVLSYEKYLSLKGECRKCVQKLTNIADSLKKNNEA